MLRFVIARTEACPNQRTVMSLPHSAVSPEDRVANVLRSPKRLTRETLAGVITALALIPEVISFSVVAGVDPKVSLIASVVLCLALSVLGGRPAMVTARPVPWRWSLARWCISTAYSTYFPPC